jgi:hypothetical protein
VHVPGTNLELITPAIMQEAPYVLVEAIQGCVPFISIYRIIAIQPVTNKLVTGLEFRTMVYSCTQSRIVVLVADAVKP